MILTKDQILAEIKSGRIKITPFDRKAIGPASIDLTLSKELRVFEHLDHAVKSSSRTDYKNITKRIRTKEKYLLRPGELVMGITAEKIKLPEDICGWLNSRSRFARLGLMVHITAPFIQPGINNKQVLEIYNASPNTLELIPGEKPCQLILQRCEGNAKYSGRWKNQSL